MRKLHILFVLSALRLCERKFTLRLQGKHGHTSFARINRNHCAFFNIIGKIEYSRNNRAGSTIRNHITHTDLYNAWFIGVGSGKNRSKIKVIGEHRIIIGFGIFMISISEASAFPITDQWIASIWLAAKNVVHRGERFMSTSSFMRTQFPVLPPATRHTEEPAIYPHVQDRDNWQEFHQ